MYILGIETSCDETSVAVVEDGVRILSNVITSQAAHHAKFGGVVPEVASRMHIETISPLCADALEFAGINMDRIDVIAVTNRPGLIGALLVGASFAKGIACRFGKPLVPVHHIRGHIAAAYLCSPPPEPPFLAFVASGGHTSIIVVEDYTTFKQLGATRDDAAGECFDKVARSLGLPYPGGALLERLAEQGSTGTVKFPLAKVSGSELDFSFSGLKTSVVVYIQKMERQGILTDEMRSDIAAAFTENVTETICSRIRKAVQFTGLKTLVCAGGVLANSHIRSALRKLADEYGLTLHIPDKSLCGDNGAMIAAQGYREFLAGNIAGLDLNAHASAGISVK